MKINGDIAIWFVKDDLFNDRAKGLIFGLRRNIGAADELHYFGNLLIASGLYNNFAPGELECSLGAFII